MNHQHRLFVALASTVLALFLLSACQRSQPPASAPAAAESKAVTAQNVFVTFEGPWAIASDPKDANSVLLMAPKTKAHRDLYVKASNEWTLAAGVYQLSVPSTSGVAGAYDPAILRAQIDPKSVQRLLDTKSDRYVIRLPKPEAYVPSGRARSRVGPTYPPDASTEKEYATGVSLRYTVSSLNGFSLAGTPDTGGAFNPLLLQVDTPSIRFAIDSSEIDDVCSTHSRTAFRDLVQLVGITLYVDFPDNPADCHTKDPQVRRPAKADAIPALFPQRLAAMLGEDSPDTQTADVASGIPAPFLTWLRSSRVVSSIAQHLAAAAVYLFGHPSGVCHAPIIGG